MTLPLAVHRPGDGRAAPATASELGTEADLLPPGADPDVVAGRVARGGPDQYPHAVEGGLAPVRVVGLVAEAHPEVLVVERGVGDVVLVDRPLRHLVVPAVGPEVDPDRQRDVDRQGRVPLAAVGCAGNEKLIIPERNQKKAFK